MTLKAIRNFVKFYLGRHRTNYDSLTGSKSTKCHDFRDFSLKDMAFRVNRKH